MPDIYDYDGALVAAIPISDNQIASLDAGATVVVSYHTPILLRDALGAQSGKFLLRKVGDMIVADDTAAVSNYAAHLDSINAIRGA